MFFAHIVRGPYKLACVRGKPRHHAQLSMEQKEIDKGLTAICGKGFRIGENVHYAPVHVNGRYFNFSPTQRQFLYLLSQNEGNLEKTCNAVGWSREQAEKFFSTRKWREYKERLLATAAVRNGELREFWWEFMHDGAKGYKERYDGVCEMCHQEYHLPPQVAEQYRDDDMNFKFTCGICKTDVKLNYHEEEFKPTREQVQCAVEIGNRVEPKTERVAHTFSDETFVFTTGENA